MSLSCWKNNRLLALPNDVSTPSKGAGTKRGQVESVRIRSNLQGKGLGTKLMRHAIHTAKEARVRNFSAHLQQGTIKMPINFIDNLGLGALS